MSDSSKKSNFGIRAYILQGLYVLGVFILVLLALMLLSSLILSHLAQPELAYGWIGYVLISFSAFAVGKFFIKAKYKGLYPWLTFVIFTAVFYLLLSLFFGNGKIELIQFLLKLISISVFSFLGAISSKKTKKRSKRQSRR